MIRKNRELVYLGETKDKVYYSNPRNNVSMMIIFYLYNFDRRSG